MTRTQQILIRRATKSKLPRIHGVDLAIVIAKAVSAQVSGAFTPRPFRITLWHMAGVSELAFRCISKPAHPSLEELFFLSLVYRRKGPRDLTWG